MKLASNRAAPSLVEGADADAYFDALGAAFERRLRNESPEQRMNRLNKEAERQFWLACDAENRARDNAYSGNREKDKIRADSAPARLKLEAECLDKIEKMFPDMQEKWRGQSDDAYDEMSKELGTNVPRLKRLMAKLRAAGRIPKHFSHPMPPRRA